MRLSTKLLVISELVLLLLVCVLLVPVRFQMRQQIIVDIQSRLNAIAATAALQIDGDAHGRLGPDSDPDGEDFQRVRDTLVAVRDANAHQGATSQRLPAHQLRGSGRRSNARPVRGARGWRPSAV